jgi:hypothetical protein
LTAATMSAAIDAVINPRPMKMYFTRGIIGDLLVLHTSLGRA